MKFNLKKYLAIVFAMLGAALTVAQFGIDMWSYSQSAFSSDIIFTIINFLVMALICFYLLSGNINSNYSAYSGMLMFVFLITFEFAEMFLFNSVSILSMLFSGEVLTALIAGAILALMAGSVATGVFSYIRTRQYISGRYYNFRALAVLSLIFMVLTVIYSLFNTVLTCIAGGGISIFTISLSGVADALLAVSVFFTVLRLRH